VPLVAPRGLAISIYRSTSQWMACALSPHPAAPAAHTLFFRSSFTLSPLDRVTLRAALVPPVTVFRPRQPRCVERLRGARTALATVPHVPALRGSDGCPPATGWESVSLDRLIAGSAPTGGVWRKLHAPWPCVAPAARLEPDAAPSHTWARVCAAGCVGSGAAVLWLAPNREPRREGQRRRRWGAALAACVASWPSSTRGGGRVLPFRAPPVRCNLARRAAYIRTGAPLPWSVPAGRWGRPPRLAARGGIVSPSSGRWRLTFPADRVQFAHGPEFALWLTETASGSCLVLTANGSLRVSKSTRM